MTKKSKSRHSGGNKKQRVNLKSILTEQIVGIFQANPKGKYNYKQIASFLDVNDAQNRKMIYGILVDMAHSGAIKEISHGKFQSIETRAILQGIIETTKRGAGYVVMEGDEDDIYIAKRIEKEH